MNAPTLFDVDAPRARRSDPTTAKNAAVRMMTAAPALEVQILDLLAKYPRGLTKDSVGSKLGIEPRRWPSVASRLSGLRRAGKLKWAEKPIDGQNVWMLIEQTITLSGDVL